MWWARLLNVISGLLAGGVAASTNSYESIATVTVGAGNASSIDFTSIAGTYKHLQLRCYLRNTTVLASLFMNFNSDSGSNYARHRLSGDGSTVSAAAAASATYMGLGDVPTTTSTFYASVIDILDYSNTSKNKTVRNLNGYDLNGSGEVGIRSNLWASTSAITSISVTLGSNQFAQYSQIALYGIKG